MVRWYHAIFTAYGFWLANDPRGSWSTFVGSWELYKFGPATKTNQRRSLAHENHDVNERLAAKKALKYPPVRFDARQRDAVAVGIGRACRESGISVHACAIGYDHVHVVTARHAKSIERVVGQFKGRAGQEMCALGSHPLQRFAKPDGAPPTAWAEGCWSVFINDVEQLREAIDYVRRHPLKEGLAAQQWDFVTPV